MAKKNIVTKELENRWNDRVTFVQSQTFSLKEDTEESKAERIKRARKDYAFFVSYYFSHLANKPCAKFHFEAAKHILAEPKARALFEWSRGHAKSSHISLMIPLWLKIQESRQMNFMVLVSKSWEAAAALLSDLQAELQFNEKFIHDFGSQMQVGSWTEGKFITTDGIKFVALGRGQSPRGLKNRGNRPNYIVIDDIDDDELSENPRRVKKALDWCLSALYGTMEAGRGRFIMVGNRIAKNSILAKYAERKNKRLIHTKVNMLDKNGLPSWSENYTLEEIAEIKEDIGSRLFEKEYMNNPITEGTVFLDKQIRFGKMLELKHYKLLVCYTDPSFKESSTADFKATKLVGKTPEGKYHVLKAYADQTSVSQMVRWHYEVENWVDGRVPVMYYMESNFLQDLLLDEFRTVGNNAGHQIPIRGDSRSKPQKEARIEAMQPLFERGDIILNEDEKDSQGMEVLKEQLLNFEKGSKSHDDAPDALEGAIWMLNRRTRTSDAPYSYGKRESRRW